jgi:photosystem II stability/assembly factor-like uncharacterized protein
MKHKNRAKTQRTKERTQRTSVIKKVFSFASFLFTLRLCAPSLLAVAMATASAQEAPAPNAKDLQPRPAERAPLAARSLLLAIARADGRFVAVGDRGVIVASTDGTSWQQMPSPVHAALTTVAFADAQQGWAAGHDAAILRTGDAGRTWQLQNFQPELNKPVLSLLALDARQAFAAGAYGLFLRTADGGKTWAPIDAPELLDDGLHLNAIIRLGNGELFVAGETGLVAVSADGAAWKRLRLPYEGSLFGALPRGARGALVFGLRGNVLYTDDVRAGKWTRVETGTVQSMFGGALLPDGTAALVGADGEMLLVGTDGRARKAAAIPHGAGTLSGVLAVDGELLVTGEAGVSRRKP